MEEGDIRFLAQVTAKTARMHAILADVEAIKVINANQLACGHTVTSPIGFDQAKAALNKLAAELEAM